MSRLLDRKELLPPYDPNALPDGVRHIPPPVFYIEHSPAVRRERGMRIFKGDLGESPWKGPKQTNAIIKRLAQSKEFLNIAEHYSDIDAIGIDLIVKRFKLDEIEGPDPRIFFGNGSDTILRDLIPFLIPLGTGETITIQGIGPQYQHFVNFVNGYPVYDSDGTRIEKQRISLNIIDANPHKKFDDIVKDALQHPKIKNTRNQIVSICDPVVPNGDVASYETIKALAELCAKNGHVLIIDEVLADGLPVDQSAIKLTKKYPGIIVVKSWSKIIGLPGIRKGYVVMSPGIGKEYANFLSLGICRSEPFTQLVFNEIYRPEILNPHLERVIPKMARVKMEFVDALMTRGLNVGATDYHNFLTLIEGGQGFHSKLLREGIIAAPGVGFANSFTPDFPTLDYVRFTIPRYLKDIKEIADRFLRAKNRKNPAYQHRVFPVIQ